MSMQANERRSAVAEGAIGPAGKHDPAMYGKAGPAHAGTYAAPIDGQHPYYYGGADFAYDPYVAPDRRSPTTAVLANMRNLLPATSLLLFLPIHLLLRAESPDARLSTTQSVVLYILLGVFAFAAGLTAALQLDRAVKYFARPGRGWYARESLLFAGRFFLTASGFLVLAYCLREPFQSDNWWSPDAGGGVAIATVVLLAALGLMEPRFLQAAVGGVVVPQGLAQQQQQPQPLNRVSVDAAGGEGPARVGALKRAAAWESLVKLRRELEFACDLLLPDERGAARVDLGRGPFALREAPMDPSPMHNTEALLAANHLTESGRGLWDMTGEPLQEAWRRVELAVVSDREVQSELRGTESKAAADALGTGSSPGPVRNLIAQVKIACGMPAVTDAQAPAGAGSQRPVARVGIANMNAAEQQVRELAPRARDAVSNLLNTMEPRWRV